MLQNNDPAPTNAAETRVSTHELTEALASIDARRTREAFARIGTVTLVEGLQDTGVEATPAEMYAEIEMLREADAAQEQVKQRQRRMKNILKAEIVSAMLCLATLFSFHQTFYNPVWQQARQSQQAAKEVIDQAQEFKRLLALTQGTHPSYIISGVPSFPGPRRDSGAIFPRYWLPEGCTVYENGTDSGMRFPPFSSLPEMIEFVSADTVIRSNRAATVSYDGVSYWRGWVNKNDVARMQKGQSFQFYLSSLPDPYEKRGVLVPVTIAKDSLSKMHPGTGFLTNGVTLFDVPFGTPIQLDSHAWEQSQNAPERS